MIRQALQNYISCFRWSNIKEMRLGSLVYIAVPLTFATSSVGKSGDLIQFFLWLMPFVFGFFTTELVPVRLPKILYLSPMHREQRVKYIYVWFWVKVCMPMILGVISAVCLICFGVLPCEWVFVLTIILNLFTLQLAICISPEYFSSRVENQRKKCKNNLKSRMPKGLGFYSVISVIVGIFVGIIFAVGVEESDFAPENIAFRMGLWIAIVLMVFLDAKLLRYVKPVLNNYVDYETALYVSWEDSYVAKSNQ